MKRKLIVFLFVIVSLLSSYYYKNNNSEKTSNDKTVFEEENSSHDEKTIIINYKDNNLEINLEDYVIGVVACEMPASFSIEALKAFSIAARTYAIYKITNNNNYILKTTSVDQCYIDISEMKNKWGNDYEKYYSKIKESVELTNGKIMKYNDEVILALYFSISNGYTEDSSKVFKEQLNYLVSTESKWDEKYNYKKEEIYINYNEFINRLGIDSISNKDITITRTSSNRVDIIKIKDKEYKGTEFRTMFNLKSTDFVIEIGENIKITTKGYGHGVGLSQYGSNAMALLGYKYEDILKYYYNEINIVNNS